MHKTIWNIAQKNTAVQEVLCRQLKVSRITAQLLANRDIYSVEEAKKFLLGTLDDLHDPFQMQGVHEAVNRIKSAVRRQERILVYGDYDVDGITGTVVLLEGLEALGADCNYYIPHRLAEGYGLNLAALQKAKDEGYSLVITVDCGISSAEEVRLARENGLDIIVTDHHEPPEQIPEALAVINPKQPGCTYPFKDLAGVGVGFKLVEALFSDSPLAEQAYDLLDLVALGTVADLVPLKGENRILTKYGLPLIAEGSRIGIKALLEAAGLADKEIGSEQIAFGLAPRLNAVGRIKHASQGVELLRERNLEVALSFAKALDRANSERKVIETVIFEEAVDIIEKNNMTDNKVLVLAREDWHLGVIGIVASKLINLYQRPVILLCIDGEQAKGSARSIAKFNLFKSLQACDELLVKYGGHSQAAGLTIAKDQIELFTRKINEIADQILREEDLAELLHIDGEVAFSEITEELYEQFVQLAPFGYGNPSPLLACRQTTALEHRTVGGDGKHLKLKVKHQNFILDAIGFNLACCKEYVDLNDKLDFIFEVQKNEWNGRSNLQLNIKDVKQYDSSEKPFTDMPSSVPETKADLVNDLFINASEYLIDDYYRDIGDKDEFYTKIVGVTFENRQELVVQLKEGDHLYLVREPDNSHDHNAVKVENSAHQQLGYLHANLAKHFAPLLDKGEQYMTLVSQVTGGQEKNYGVNIIIQKVQQQDFEKRMRLLRETRERLRKLDEEQLLEAVRQALLGEYSYRDSQLDALNSLEDNNNTLAIFGTGRGKSAVFQTMAALKAIRHKELTVIVYPLRALVNDQYEAMQKKMVSLGMRIYKGNGSLSSGERAMLFSALEAGEIDILLTTPEFLLYHMNTFHYSPKKVGFFVVDESHHISMASLSHRPAYKRVSEIVEGLGCPLTLAVTATANDEVAQEIVESLSIEQSIIDTHVRTNLQLVDKRDVKDKQAYLKNIAATGGKTIIYVNSRLKAVELALFLKESIPELTDKIVYYHAGLKNEYRHAIERMFKEGELSVVISTSAFGEGIDIPDVRHVVLFHLNFNFTEFNQQCGRGGRDGEFTQIHLLCGERDVKINEFILEMASPDRKFLAALYKLLQYLNKGKQPIELTNKELAEKLQKAGIRMAKDSSVSAALGVFDELGFIQRETAGRYRQIYLNPAPDKKIELENSLRYLEGQEEKKAFREFNQMFFSASSDTLLKFINRPIYPENLVLPSNSYSKPE